MPMLAFLPWLRLREAVRVGPFHAFPQGIGDTPPYGVELCISPETMTKVLGQHCLAPRLPLQVVTVVQYEGRPLGEELDEQGRAELFRFGRHLAVAGMSGRRFIGGFPDEYTASGHYQVVIQAFQDPYRGGVSLTHRRKGGHSSVTMGQTEVQFFLPDYLVGQGVPTIDLPLLEGLRRLRSLPKAIHEDTDASITQFLLANSDSPDVSLDVLSIATYAALERVSNSSQRLDDVQAKVPALLSIVEESPWTEQLRDELQTCVEDGQPVLHSWLHHLYRLRGNLAHGKPEHWAPNDWNQQEHLVAGAFVYPLVLKCLLSSHKHYPLTHYDVAHVLGLEDLLGDKPFYGTRTSWEEDELEVRARSGWLKQFERINNALLGMELSAAIRKSMDEIERREQSGDGNVRA